MSQQPPESSSSPSRLRSVIRIAIVLLGIVALVRNGVELGMATRFDSELRLLLFSNGVVIFLFLPIWLLMCLVVFLGFIVNMHLSALAGVWAVVAALIKSKREDGTRFCAWPWVLLFVSSLFLRGLLHLSAHILNWASDDALPLLVPLLPPMLLDVVGLLLLLVLGFPHLVEMAKIARRELSSLLD